MPILVSCTCGKRFQTPGENAGRRSRCPECGKHLVIPREKPPAEPEPFTTATSSTTTDADVFGAPVSGKAVASLSLGILSLFCTFFAGLPAVILGWQGLKDIKTSKGRVRGRGVAAAGMILGCFGSTALSFFIATPLVLSLRESGRSVQCAQNLKEIALALHNFQSSYNALPPQAICDRKGQPLLSWRVAILPYLGREGAELYKQFHLDEPWDSEHNRSLLGQRPDVFACPSDPRLGRALTSYQVVVGPRTLFPGGRRGISVDKIADGSSNTLMVTEAAVPVPWTSPQDLPFDPSVSLFGMGSRHDRGFQIAFADGSVLFLPGTIKPGVLAGIITRDGGEVVTVP